uniref:protein EXPRESSION OF TERPENOIDS 1-like n=1 Tax=Erigeron canadensis TaxID=72917 RepID=UPI001CB8EC3D|nr:protein EXPRESSION OF TERPENOIDS 1-like [Erigeron canadensis]
MSSFFSLETTGFSKVDKQNQYQHHHHHQDQDQEHDDDIIISPYSLYLFKNNKEIYNKGFELWQQYYQLHQQQQQHYGGCDHRKKSTSTSSEGGGGGMMRQGGGYGGGSSSGGGGGGVNCQDCGNQAKKDCQHMRCRTCCKNRGFLCQTHVKSTWVPASKRRERQQQLMSLASQQNLGTQNLSLMMRASGSSGGGGSDQNPKRPREDHISGTGGGVGGSGGGSGVNLPVAQHHNTSSSGLQVSHFPAELSSPAVFRCVRVSAMNEAEEQLAYQTALNIGGHVFKGILYDHGPVDSGYMNHPGEGSSSGGGGGGGSVGGAQLHNLITSGTMGATTAATTTSINQGVNFIDPSSRYPTPFSAFMAGTQFFPPPR